MCQRLNLWSHVCYQSIIFTWRVQPPCISLSFSSPFTPKASTEKFEKLCKSYSGTFEVNQTIKNTVKKEILGNTLIEALLVFLKESNSWLWDVAVNAPGAIQHPFFPHPGSINIAQINHHVAILSQLTQHKCHVELAVRGQRIKV
ncbi:uncharacterized protein VP01_1712g1 [Puccinia sorghi]|uniref:Uncharacterized protein n=1 Tax=Puccinia sorghi TaxID=27349 RepID=A0A0L6VG41_9BASI|nr:uncharacterized protein VP01_1712g1 [Puccinia sorghi]